MNRRMSLLSSAYIPVQDGLLLWMDGIKNTRLGHSTTPTAWEDLSGNNIDGVYIGNVIYDENGFIVDKQSGISYVADDGASKWYSLRYYNRTLKQEEIVKNFKQDKRRYKF